ncbi:hypothetical protein E3N88_09663 [Mikania micrantha]|uniref:NB-ARC domain-containing protein n=1 Tax=Mikania micrantha TaxID=192012 RepID=A0A5N6PKK3_9ASTR|nr:hypothetical protein E3N88_09663 [Mikania micrantha]
MWDLDLIESTLSHRHEAKFIQKTVKEISLKLHVINWSIDEDLVGIETRGTEATRSMGLKNPDIHPAIFMKSIRKMKELRLLYVYDWYCSQKKEIKEDVQNLPDTLQSLCWACYPFCCLPITFQANNLVNLEMPQSYISQLWEGGERKGTEATRCMHLKNPDIHPAIFMKGLRKMKELRLLCVYGNDLSKKWEIDEGGVQYLPDTLRCLCWTASICGLMHLTTLALDGNIPEAPKYLWKLKSLEKLTLSMKEIKHLPYYICTLKHLKSLDLKSCWLLEHLPMDLGGLDSLEELHLTDCVSLRDIPDSIRKMKCLKLLNIEGAGIRRLPESIFQLKDLRIIGSTRQLKSYGFTSVKKFQQTQPPVT